MFEWAPFCKGKKTELIIIIITIEILISWLSRIIDNWDSNYKSCYFLAQQYNGHCTDEFPREEADPYPLKLN